jgi:hypothetical protein
MKTLTKFIYLPFAAFALACFALLPRAQAAPDPADPPASNTRDGQFSMDSITTGINNSAFGTNALNKLTIGNNNAAQGNSAQFSLIDGSNNTALGVLALRLNVHGNDNTAVGRDALLNNTGNFNTAIGHQAGNAITRNWNIDIGKDVFGIGGATGDNFVTRIGIGDTADAHVQTACYIGGIFGQTAASGSLVYVNAIGKLGTTTSSRRFKDEIKPMDKSSEAILALKPVTFRYKQEIDPNGIPQFGLVAEDVEKVNPDLVIRDAKGEINTVRYVAVNAMLLNEFLKEHRTVRDLKSTVAKQEKQIKALTTGLQKVSDQLELSKSAPRTVLNNQ